MHPHTSHGAEVIPVRWTNLKWMMLSPAHMKHYAEKPVALSTAMRVGAMTHSLVLGGSRTFAVYHGIRRGKEWEAFLASATENGDEVISENEAAVAKTCADALLADSLAVSLLDGDREQTVKWVQNGILCQGTPDVVGPHGTVELKVTDMPPQRLPWHARRMGWLGQLAWYESGLDFKDVSVWLYIVTVSPKPPHLVTSYMLTDAAHEAGTRLAVSLWERFKTCHESGVWGGYGEGLQIIDAPDDEDVTLTIGGEEIEL